MSKPSSSLAKTSPSLVVSLEEYRVVSVDPIAARRARFRPRSASASYNSASSLTSPSPPPPPTIGATEPGPPVAAGGVASTTSSLMRAMSAAGTRRRRSYDASRIVNANDLVARRTSKTPRSSATSSIEAPPSTMGSHPLSLLRPSRWGRDPENVCSTPSTARLPKRSVTAMTWPRIAVTVVIALLLEATDLRSRLDDSTRPSALATHSLAIKHATRDARGTTWMCRTLGRRPP